MVGGDPSLPVVVNGLPSELGVCDTARDEWWLLFEPDVEVEEDEVVAWILLINGWNWAYLGSILSIMNLDDILSECHIRERAQRSSSTRVSSVSRCDFGYSLCPNQKQQIEIFFF